MSYLYSLFSKTIDYVSVTADYVIIAPAKVIKDKIYDKIVSEKKQKEILRMRPKNSTWGEIYSFFCDPEQSEWHAFFKDPTEVYPRIFLGSAYNAATKETLKNKDIRFIINVSSEMSKYSDLPIYHQILIKDDNDESIHKYLEETVEKIDTFLANNEGNILIHCFMGASRSATIVAYYIAQKNWRRHYNCY